MSFEGGGKKRCQSNMTKKDDGVNIVRLPRKEGGVDVNAACPRTRDGKRATSPKLNRGARFVLKRTLVLTLTRQGEERKEEGWSAELSASHIR